MTTPELEEGELEDGEVDDPIDKESVTDSNNLQAGSDSIETKNEFDVEKEGKKNRKKKRKHKRRHDDDDYNDKRNNKRKKEIDNRQSDKKQFTTNSYKDIHSDDDEWDSFYGRPSSENIYDSENKIPNRKFSSSSPAQETEWNALSDNGRNDNDENVEEERRLRGIRRREENRRREEETTEKSNDVEQSDNKFKHSKKSNPGRDRRSSQQQADRASFINNEGLRVCRFFSDGTCHRGDKCKYKHETPVQSRPRVPRRRLELCKFFLNSICTKGSECIYMHGDYPCKYHHMGMGCYSSDNCKFSHSTLTEETKMIVERMKAERRNGVSMSKLDEISNSQDESNNDYGNNVGNQQFRPDNPPRKQGLLGSSPDSYRLNNPVSMDHGQLPINFHNQVNTPFMNHQSQGLSYNNGYSSQAPPLYTHNQLPPLYSPHQFNNNNNINNNNANQQIQPIFLDHQPPKQMLGTNEISKPVNIEPVKNVIPSIFDLDVRPTPSLNLSNFDRSSTPPGDADFVHEEQTPIVSEAPIFSEPINVMPYQAKQFPLYSEQQIQGYHMQQNILPMPAPNFQNRFFRPNLPERPNFPIQKYNEMQEQPQIPRNVLNELLTSVRNDPRMQQVSQKQVDPRINDDQPNIEANIIDTPILLPEKHDTVNDTVIQKQKDFEVYSFDGEVKEWKLFQVTIEAHQCKGTLPNGLTINSETQINEDPRIAKVLKNQKNGLELPDLNEISQGKSKSLSAPSGFSIPSALLKAPISNTSSTSNFPNNSTLHQRTLSTSSDEQDSVRKDTRSYISDPRFKKKTKKAVANENQSSSSSSKEVNSLDNKVSQKCSIEVEKPPPTLSELNADDEISSSNGSMGVKELFQAWDPTSSPFLGYS